MESETAVHRHRHVSQWRRDGQPMRQQDQLRSGRPPVDAPAALTPQISHGAFEKKLRRLGVAEVAEDAAARLDSVRGGAEGQRLWLRLQRREWRSRSQLRRHRHQQQRPPTAAVRP